MCALCVRLSGRARVVETRGSMARNQSCKLAIRDKISQSRLGFRMVMLLMRDTHAIKPPLLGPARPPPPHPLPFSTLPTSSWYSLFCNHLCSLWSTGLSNRLHKTGPRGRGRIIEKERERGEEGAGGGRESTEIGKIYPYPKVSGFPLRAVRSLATFIHPSIVY